MSEDSSQESDVHMHQCFLTCEELASVLAWQLTLTRVLAENAVDSGVTLQDARLIGRSVRRCGELAAALQGAKEAEKQVADAIAAVNPEAVLTAVFE